MRRQGWGNENQLASYRVRIACSSGAILNSFYCRRRDEIAAIRNLAKSLGAKKRRAVIRRRKLSTSRQRCLVLEDDPGVGSRLSKRPCCVGYELQRGGPDERSCPAGANRAAAYANQFE
jgi:hypothetical protein